MGDRIGTSWNFRIWVDPYIAYVLLMYLICLDATVDIIVALCAYTCVQARTIQRIMASKDKDMPDPSQRYGSFFGY